MQDQIRSLDMHLKIHPGDLMELMVRFYTADAADYESLRKPFLPMI